jgi:Raf kinase inhibitor-like YbhB/YbcL family protein
MMRVLGRLLRRWRAGAEFRVGEDDRFSGAPRIELVSAAFAPDGPMPPTAESPPLAWGAVPEETRSIALVMEDVDVPFPRPLVHVIAYAIDPGTTELPAGALEATRTALGYNGAGRLAYLAPAPIPGHGPHHYVFTLLAVDYVPRFDQSPTRGRLLDAIAGHVVALGELTGTVERR